MSSRTIQLDRFKIPINLDYDDARTDSNMWVEETLSDLSLSHETGEMQSQPICTRRGHDSLSRCSGIQGKNVYNDVREQGQLKLTHAPRFMVKRRETRRICSFLRGMFVLTSVSLLLLLQGEAKCRSDLPTEAQWNSSSSAGRC